MSERFYHGATSRSSRRDVLDKSDIVSMICQVLE